MGKHRDGAQRIATVARTKQYKRAVCCCAMLCEGCLDPSVGKATPNPLMIDGCSGDHTIFPVSVGGTFLLTLLSCKTGCRKPAVLALEPL